MTHVDGLTSYCRRWGKDYASYLCEFGESVCCSSYLGNSKKKVTLHGIPDWLGRDTEADENIVFHEIRGVVEVRTVRRQVFSKQWSQELLMKLSCTPWDPKA